MQDVAMGDLGYERKIADYYPTPAWVTEALIPYLGAHVQADTPVWECACGSGEMAEVLREHFETVNASDLYDYGYRPSFPDTNFLSWSGKLKMRTAVVTNPPYGRAAESFIRKALDITEEAEGVVAMLLRNEYDSASTRTSLFRHQAFARKVILTSRPRWVPDSTGAPRHNYSWFLWDWAWDQNAIISYATRSPKS